MDTFHAQRQAVKRWRKRNPDKVKAANKRWEERNPDKVAGYMADYKRRLVDTHPEKHMFLQVRTRAKKNGIEFSISEEDISIPEACPLLGILIFFDMENRYSPHTPSLDRIDNSKGYVPGNVWVISRKANAMKFDASISELKTFANNVLAQF